MDAWGVDEVIRFLKEEIKGLTPADVDRLIDKVRDNNVDGKELSRCMNVNVCQSLFELPIVKAGNVARAIRKYLPAGAPPRKQTEETKTVPTFERKELFHEPSKVFKPDEAVPADLKTAELSKAKYVHWSAGGLGSTGVFFVDVGSGWVVAKPTGPGTAGEVFATLLAKQLEIECPAYRVEDISSQQTTLSAMRFAPGKQEHLQRLRNSRIQGLVFMELVKGYPLPACGIKVLAESSAKTLLHQMGEVVVLDMITNNFDRLPFIWTNFGNMENIMVQGNVREDDGALTIACIDQGTTCITNDDGHRKYMERVRAGAVAACVDKSTTDPHFTRLRNAIINGAGHDIGEEGCEVLMEGIHAGCRKLTALLEQRPNLFQELAKQTEEVLQGIAELREGTVAFVKEAAGIVTEVFAASDLAS